MSASHLRTQIDSVTWDIDDLKKGHGTPAGQWWLEHFKQFEPDRGSSIQVHKAQQRRVHICLPLRLSLHCPLGHLGSLPDLRLSLVEISRGTQMDCHAQSAFADNASRPTITVVGEGSEGRHSGSRHLKQLQHYRLWPFYSPEDVFHCAGALLLVTAVMPGHVGPAVDLLSRRCIDIHAAVLLWRWATQVLRTSPPAHYDPRRLMRNAKERVTPTAAKERGVKKRICCSSSPSSSAAVDATAASGIILRFAVAARLLTACGSLWAWVHPTSHSLAVALAALLTVSYDSGRLRRDMASGRLQHGVFRLSAGIMMSKEAVGIGQEANYSDLVYCLPHMIGPPLERAWQAHHKRSGRRVAHLLSDLPESPPLGPLVSLAERLSIRVGSPVDGCGHFGGWAVPHETCRFSVSGG